MPVLRSDPSVAERAAVSKHRSVEPWFGSDAPPQNSKHSSFATPGPAVGVSSLASRIDNLRGWTIELAWPDRLFLRTFCESVSIHRYYDQLRLPNARPRFLRHPARPLVPVVSAFELWIDPAERRAFPSLGALISRWTPTKCSLRLIRAL